MPSPGKAAGTCLVVDDGLFVHVAEGLTKGFDKVLYALALRQTSPKACFDSIAKGLEVERVDDLFSALDRADVVVFPDVYTGDIASHARKLGKPIFGATKEVADLEMDRWMTRQLVRDAGLPVVKAVRIVGLDSLEDHLRHTKDKWVKGLRYRGDFETFHHVDWFTTKPWFVDLSNKLGPRGSGCIFVVEDAVNDAVEVGTDAAVVNGVWPETVSWGYEDKGAGYVGKVQSYKDLPKPIKEVSDKFATILKERSYTGFVSLEIRVKDSVPYFIDPALRAGLPPSESYVELFSNWPDFIRQAANGKRTDLRPAAKYSAQMQLTSDFAREHFLAWDIPEEERRWVKLQNHFRQNDVDYCCPNGDTLVGAVTAIGDSLEEVKGKVLERAGKVKAYNLDYDEASLDRLEETVEKGRKLGMEF